MKWDSRTAWIRSALSGEQLQPFQRSTPNASILAAAGSGKTNTLVHLLAADLALGIPASGIIAFTFTEKAGEELLARIHDLVARELSDVDLRGIYIGTIHGWCFQYILKDRDFYNFTSVDELHLDALVSRLYDTLNLTKVYGLAYPKAIPKFLADLEIYYNEHLPLSAVPSKIKPSIDTFLKILMQNRLITFGGMVRTATEQLIKAGPVAELSAIYVDEYQDVNPAQVALVKAMSPFNAKIVAVGDDLQCIYQWRGSDVTRILRFDTDFPSVSVHRLTTNFRSRPAIVNLANDVADKISLRDPLKTMRSARKENTGVAVHWISLATEKEQSKVVTKMIKQFKEKGVSYREWMKFQKSFFRYSSNQILIKECIEFFTKAMWTDGRPSRSLVLNFNDFDVNGISKPRIVHSRSGFQSIRRLINHLVSLIERNEQYDFIIIDMRTYFKDRKALSNFLLKYSAKMFTSLRKLLFNERYCGIIVNTERNSAISFPIPWSIAQSSRAYLKLRDEKIALLETTGRIFYCLFMQGRDDERKGLTLTPQTFRLAKTAKAIPAWVIPKPPPRKKNEILHPAKFPETLIEEFIELFTKPNDSVFDPMVGTGSAVVAAIHKDRSGFGLELSRQYAEIASNRVSEEISHSANLFGFRKHQVEAKIIEGNALRLAAVPGLAKMRFNYVVTSPPYWSMLRNPGSEYQEGRRKRNLPLIYSGDKSDLGNVEDYDEFLDLLDKVYNDVASKLCDGGILTVILKNVKRYHVLYTLAWDLAIRLCGRNGKYEYIGTTLWCQDDVGLKPFAVGIHWVSNILHQYCLHFRKWDDL